MADKTDNSGKELLDMDEKGNPIEKEEKKIQKKLHLIFINMVLLLLFFFY